MDQLDHVVVAAPDLDDARQRFEAEAGVSPVEGGSHTGLGTRNALVSFGGSVYLEIIAPDPEQDLAGTFGERLGALEEPMLFHWAVRVSGLAAVRTRVRAAGLEASAILPAARTLPTGDRLRWELMGVGGHDLGGVVPFFIDWIESPQPSESAPHVGRLLSFEVTLDHASPVRALLQPVPDGITLTTGDPALAVEFESPKGVIRWTTGEALPLGFRL